MSLRSKCFYVVVLVMSLWLRTYYNKVSSVPFKATIPFEMMKV